MEQRLLTASDLLDDDAVIGIDDLNNALLENEAVNKRTLPD